MDSPKKIEPPPKPEEPKPAIAATRVINNDINQRAVTYKSIRQLKSDLGDLTEEVKYDMERSMSQIIDILKHHRGTLFNFLVNKVDA